MAKSEVRGQIFRQTVCFEKSKREDGFYSNTHQNVTGAVKRWWAPCLWNAESLLSTSSSLLVLYVSSFSSRLVSFERNKVSSSSLSKQSVFNLLLSEVSADALITNFRFIHAPLFDPVAHSVFHHFLFSQMTSSEKAQITAAGNLNCERSRARRNNIYTYAIYIAAWWFLKLLFMLLLLSYWVDI